MTTSRPEPRVARPAYGRNLIDSLPRTLFERPIVITQPEPYDPAIAAETQLLPGVFHFKGGVDAKGADALLDGLHHVIGD